MADAIGGGTVKVAKVTLTSAQVLALVSTPQTLVPAPGAGMTADSVMVASQSGSAVVASFSNAPVLITADDVPADGNSPVTVSVVYTLIGL